jgi:peptidoglycan/LPS O-acetylase OafA/YrhL
MSAWPTAAEAAAPGRGDASVPAGRVQGLEGLRGVAAFAVVLTHVGFLSGAVGGRVLPGVLSRLDFGVCLFFVLSGFLLFRPWARAAAGARRPDLRSYAVRRAARLVPAWLLAMAGTWLLLPQTRTVGASTWLAYLTQTQIYRHSGSIGPLNQLWSLATEVAFYLALPLLALLVLGRRGRTSGTALLARLAALALLAWAFRALVAQDLVASRIALQWLPAHLDWFAGGMALAVVAGPDPGPWGRRVARFLRVAATPLRVGALVLFWLCTTPLAGPLDLLPPTTSQDLIRHISYLLMALAVVGPICVDAHDPVRRFLHRPRLEHLGTISYGVFLWHLPLLYAVRSALGLGVFRGGFWASLLVTSIISVAVATISWLALERPVLRVAHRYRGSDVRRSAATTPAPR